MSRPGWALLAGLGLLAFAGWVLLAHRVIPTTSGEGGSAHDTAAEPEPRTEGGGSDVPGGEDGAVLRGHDLREARREASAHVVVGLVYDRETRAPLSGVTVTLCGGEETPSASTDERGIYRLELPRVVEWYTRLGFQRTGYVGCAQWQVERSVSAAGRIEPVGMKPIRAELPGRVVDWRGGPVADARVRIDEAGTWFRSDAAGRFGPVPVGGRQIKWEAWAPDGARTEDYLDLAPHLPREIRIQLVPHGTITGMVVDEAGESIPRAEIHHQGNAEERRLRADSKGRFRWPSSFDGGARLIAVTDGQAGMRWGRAGLPMRIVVRPMEDGAWRWKFGPRWAPPPPPKSGPAPGPIVTIPLRLVDERGAPLAWAEVHWQWWKMTSRGEEWSDSDGVCHLSVASEVEVKLDVHHRAAHGLSVRKIFDAGRTRELRLELRYRPPAPPVAYEPEEPAPPEPALRGVVLDAQGRPRAGVSVDAPPWGSDTTGPWGRWRIKNDQAGRLAHVRITADGYAPIETLGTFDGPEAVTRLPARGAIRVKLDGVPDEDDTPTVRLWKGLDFDHDVLWQLGECVLGDGDGYRIDCPEGVWTIAFRLEPGRWAIYPDVRVVAGEETPLRYSFPTFGRLRVWARTDAGELLPGACVSIALTDCTIGHTDEMGLLEVADFGRDDLLPAGSVRLRVDADGYAPLFTRPVDLRRDESVEVKLSPGVRAKGVLRDASGQPLVASVAWAAPHGRSIYEVESERDGTFELSGWLPPGRTTLVVRQRGFERLRASIDVLGGAKAVPVDLRVP